jgi:type I restriction enzyme R subunit
VAYRYPQISLRSQISRVQDFFAKQATRDEVKIQIKNYLWDDKTGLPESFDPEEIDDKTDAVFAHLIIGARNESTMRNMDVYE